ncbi:Hermansky-Pudlak syndrome 5 protein homolog [Galendromus occidentalis]|uniref:Hermansky-Pudlak syndrome 5 protein homolog n=1 Tax=Galendromus occidentalis TaxID=34638 RepID=A0AAJ6QSZ3_9ACAR|nr:Hermansky-Pudlak syndrome 5 protein homolog [Galendromus occidentalis]
MTCVFEARNHEKLNRALLSGRNRFRCFDVSQNFIGAGSSSGDVFLFERDSQQLIRRIPAASAKIDRIAFNPAVDSILCIATNRGELTVLEVRESENSSKDAQVLFSVQSHLKNLVTQLVWSSTGAQLIAGDNAGVVSITDVYSLNDAVLFEFSPTNALALDSDIVQIDAASDRILISTLTAAYLFDLDERYFTKVGKKPRNGVYGACFFSLEDAQESDQGTRLEIFCARPGGRLWRVNPFGEVECTLNFKHEGSTSIDHSSVSLLGNWRVEGLFTQKVNFGKLVHFEQWLLSFTETALFVLDVCSSEVPRVVWQSTELKDSLIDVSVFDDSIFLTLRDGTLLEWQIALTFDWKIMYMLPTPAQRLAVTCRNWTEKHFECLDIIRRRESLGKEVSCRSSEWRMIPSGSKGPIYLSVPILLTLLRYYEGILLSTNPRNFWADKLVYILPPEVLQPQAVAAPQKKASGNPEAPDPPSAEKEIQVTREKHRKLLCDIISRRQKEIADFMLVELSASLWAPRAVQEKHSIDQPLVAWGMRMSFVDCCDSCGESLVVEGFDEDLQIHFCGHKFHLTCNPTNRLCCICMQM